MSSYVVEKETIDIIVTALQAKGRQVPEVLQGDPSGVGFRLWEMNHEAAFCAPAGAYRFKFTEAPLDNILGHIEKFKYQCSAHGPAWAVTWKALCFFEGRLQHEFMLRQPGFCAAFGLKPAPTTHKEAK